MAALESLQRWKILNGDSAKILQEFPDDYFDAMVTDPPSGTGFMNQYWDKDKGGRDRWVEWLTDIMREVWRVLKPGAHILVWSLPRTSHWTAYAVENAGFEIRDQISHVTGSGFPKNLLISNTYKKNGQESAVKQWGGWGTALKPAYENYILGKKPSSTLTVAETTYAVTAFFREILWQTLHAKFVEKFFMLNPHDSKEARCAFVQCRAAVNSMQSNSALSGQTGMFLLPETGSILLNIGLLWKNILGESWIKPNTYTTETVIDLITDLRILSLSISQTIQNCTTLDATKANGQQSNVCIVVNLLNDVLEKLKTILKLIVVAPAGEIAKSPINAQNVLRQRENEPIGVPSCEYFTLARKPFKGSVAENVLKYGTGALNIDDCRIAAKDFDPKPRIGTKRYMDHRPWNDRQLATNSRPTITEGNSLGRWPSHLLISHDPRCVRVGTKKVKSSDRVGHTGKQTKKSMFGTEKSMHSSVKHGDKDGMETVDQFECVDDCPVKIIDTQSGVSISHGGRINKKSMRTVTNVVAGNHRKGDPGFGDKGGASRFFKIFYAPKPSVRERETGLENFTPETVNDGRQTPIDNPYQRGETERKNTHPTVKAIALMRYLCRLITPPNGIILDPFTGSGSTGCAAIREGFRFVGIENEENYCAVSEARIEHYNRQMLYHEFKRDWPWF